ncbi:uroporphyrinogen-III C-methyltransferase [Sodalis-like endosymbiont of Proechinophthirus fluctus]|uniref:uroporphyrinogen-III C-methyltransferase n=1 Tax=Sodalis-like endosymbiont of Proechinophthirus fluctus TaxID=1462730 RepID=UPI001FCC95A0|nr:uroporphyrinogen-III C-methyltransferase [Sodalis-like endosymbiont of Proechinophthirus fluctus]
MLATAALVITVLLAISVYIAAQLQAHQQEAAYAQLQASLDKLNQVQQTQYQQYQESLAAHRKVLDAARAHQESQGREMEDLQKKLTAITGTNANTWLLSQADFLVKIAGRKLWSDQDVVTAGALLKIADASLAQMNDPSLTEARRAITEDIGTLAGVSQIDFDGIILKLNQLTNQVDNLQLADNDSDKSPIDSDSGELSGSIQEWRKNLSKSWHNFMNDFITVRRRDTGTEPLLSPNQDVYLRENIRARLLVAAQAVPRHHNEIYQQSLDSVSTWVRVYFDADDANTRAFLSQLDALVQEDIAMNLPDSLQSQLLLDKLMQTRVHNLLAQSGRTGRIKDDQDVIAIHPTVRGHCARPVGLRSSGICTDPDR